MRVPSAMLAEGGGQAGRDTGRFGAQGVFTGGFGGFALGRLGGLNGLPRLNGFRCLRNLGWLADFQRFHELDDLGSFAGFDRLRSRVSNVRLLDCFRFGFGIVRTRLRGFLDFHHRGFFGLFFGGFGNLRCDA